MRFNSSARALKNGLSLSLFVCLSLLSVGSFAQNEPAKDGRYYESAARKAYQNKDYPAFLEGMKLAAQLRPNHPRLMYNLAVAHALNGQRAEALGWLAKVAAMGMVVRAASDPDFASIRDSAEFRAITARIETNKLPVGKSTPAFTIHEKGLVPESVAFDPVTNSFFVSSIYKRKIMRITKDGSVSDFAVEADGLWSVFGMKVDSARRVLWACTAAHPQMSHYDANENGASAILKFDLRTGKLVKKYLLPNDSGKHLLGDLALNSRGEVFASDSISPTIYFIRSGGKELEVFVESKSLVSPQGLAFSADEKNLFLADYSNGIFVIDMKTKKITNCPAPADGTLLGIDGLYSYRGGLIAVQNGVEPQRVVRLSLTPDLTRIKRVETIAANEPAFDEPTLGVLLKDSFYFVANSQWGAIDEKGQLSSEDKLKEPIILKLKLRG
jgi:sugar lactone lactonase YvrE